MKIIAIRSEEGKIVTKDIVEGDLAEQAKLYAQKAFQEWDPSRSDFTVLRSKYELRLKLPIDPDLLDIIEELNLPKRIEFGELVVEIPLITISFDNEWVGENYFEKKMYIIAPYVSDETVSEIERYAIEATREAKNLAALSTEPQLDITEDELRRLEEGLEEIEKAEKGKSPRKRKTRRRRKKQS